MKRLILLLCLLPVVVAMGAIPSSFVVNLSPFDSDTVDDYLPPKSVVEEDSTGITVTYEFPTALFVPDDVYEDTYWCRLEGFGETGDDGEPSLLQHLDIFDIPANCIDARVSLLSCRDLDLSVPLAPAREMLFDSSDKIFTKANVSPIQNSTFAGDVALVSRYSFSRQRNRSQVEVLIKPVQYDSHQKLTKIFYQLKYRIDYVFGAEEKMTYSVSKAIGDIAVPQPLDSISFSRIMLPVDKSYLIITCDKHIAAADSLAELKRKYGMTTYVSSMPKWTSVNVSDTIEHYYSHIPNLTYVLLWGSYDDIMPCSYYDSGALNTVITDQLYTVQDKSASSFYRRFYIGRIPVSNLSESYDVLDKIYSYTLSPPDEMSYYSTGVNVAYFQGFNSNPGVEQRGYIRCSEQIRDSLMPCGYDVKRIYSSAVPVPRYWSDGTPLPEELSEGNYDWNNGPASIADAINKGAFYVFHRDHGSAKGWEFPEFKTSHLNLLKNERLLPIIFSINCLTGKFNDSDCFATEILKRKNVGCAGIIAATQVTYTNANNVQAVGLFSAIKNDKKSTSDNVPSPISLYGAVDNRELGRMLEVGLYKMKEQYPAYYRYHSCTYHVFGDPSMIMWTSFPVPIQSEEYAVCFTTQIVPGGVRRVAKSIDCNFDCDTYLSVYNTETRQSRLYFGQMGEINVDFSKEKAYAYRNAGTLTEITPVLKKPWTPVDGGLSLNVVPNPAQSICEIKCKMPSEAVSVEFLVNSLSSGALIETLSESAVDDAVIDVSRYPDGQYVVTAVFKSADGEVLEKVSEKIIVNKK